MYLAYLLTFFLAFYLVYLRRFFVVEVQRGTLWSGARFEVRRGPLRSGACGGGPAGTTAIKSLQLRSGGDHCDQKLAVEFRQRRRRSRRREETADIKSNDLHLTGGEQRACNLMIGFLQKTQSLQHILQPNMFFFCWVWNNGPHQQK